MSWVARVLDELLQDGPRVVTLDEIGEAIGLDWAQPDQIERLFEELEARGAVIADSPGSSLAPLLHRVLGTARDLRAQGAPSSPEAIAQASGLSTREVRVALLYGEVLSRS